MNVQAVFLDRDGVINKEVDLLHRPDQLELIPGAAAAIRRLNEAQILVIVVTNQPVVARALCSEDDVREIHRQLREMLANESGAHLDDVYFCPHHPETHHADGDPRYRVTCSCRKPAIGMLERARSKFDLTFDQCVMVGDTTSDIKAGMSAGCVTVLVRSGYGGSDSKYDVEPTIVSNDLAEAVTQILKLSAPSST